MLRPRFNRIFCSRLRIWRHAAYALFALVLFGCHSATATKSTMPSGDPPPPPLPLSLIPQPYSLHLATEFFELREATTLSAISPDSDAQLPARYFVDLMQRTRGLHLNLQASAREPVETARNDVGNRIVFQLDSTFAASDDSTDEGYRLTVVPRRITIVARTPHGLFNGAVTLWQLATADPAARDVRIQCLTIEDHPHFVWRGLMLDPARHFQSPEYVKQFIDWMALHKYNVLHWHLTDDQGWRIQIKKYPKLIDIGAWRQPAGAAGVDANGKPVRYGGYYTQEQIRDIVAYAQQRFVTIVPEIEMPGHAQAAIAAYPQLGVTGKNPGVSHDWGVHTYLYNVDESTITFLQDVLTETMALFPSPYIHIGGDEAAKDQWKASAHVQQRMRELRIGSEAALQSWLIKRMETFLNAHGRKLIGWDEILEGGLPEQATVMSWRGIKGAIEAAKQGHDVVLSPDPDLYFDHLPGDLVDEPAGRPAVISLQDVYRFNPIPSELDATQARHVLGAQANLWSEYFQTETSLTRATYPRAAALAEALWSPASARDWQGFLDRLVAQQARYRALGIGYAQSAFAVRIDADYDTAQTNVMVKLSNQTNFGKIHYTLDGSLPGAQSPQYTAPFHTDAAGQIQATAFALNQALADPQTRKLDVTSLLRRTSVELAPCRAGTGVSLRLPDPTPAAAGSHPYLVEIFDPCWVWPQVELNRIQRLRVDVASLPYNFQLWNDAKSVVSRKPKKYPRGELQIHQDRCDGHVLATLALSPEILRSGKGELSTDVSALSGTHDLCLQFATGGHDPMRVVDAVQLTPRAAD
jgi:hexosaminidase